MQMAVCSEIGFNSVHGFCLNNPESTYGVVDDFSVNELANLATKFLKIQDAEETNEKSVFQNSENLVNKNGEIKVEDNVILTTEVLTHDDNARSLPNVLQPVSAIKGSREKRGVIPSDKLTVKWDPEVYDPIPTLRVVIHRPRKISKKVVHKRKIKYESKSRLSRLKRR